jgi:hypothetical protein
VSVETRFFAVVLGMNIVPMRGVRVISMAPVVSSRRSAFRLDFRRPRSVSGSVLSLLLRCETLIIFLTPWLHGPHHRHRAAPCVTKRKRFSAISSRADACAALSSTHLALILPGADDALTGSPFAKMCLLLMFLAVPAPGAARFVKLWRIPHRDGDETSDEDGGR